MAWEEHLPKEIHELYEVHNYRNAAQILNHSAPTEFWELMEALVKFRITLDDIRKPGGNESGIPKKVSLLLRDKGWKETRIQGNLVIFKSSLNKTRKKDVNEDEDDEEEDEEIIVPSKLKLEEMKKKGYDIEEFTVPNFLDGHKVDYVKNRVAFDLEWNSKDQTFDRDLYALRAFYECNLIEAGVLLTRSKELNPIFEQMGPELDKEGKPVIKRNGKTKLIKEKYGASTTWMGKLRYRLDAGRNGGCPVLALGIKPALISDLKNLNEKIKLA